MGVGGLRYRLIEENGNEIKISAWGSSTPMKENGSLRVSLASAWSLFEVSKGFWKSAELRGIRENYRRSCK